MVRLARQEQLHFLNQSQNSTMKMGSLYLTFLSQKLRNYIPVYRVKRKRNNYVESKDLRNNHYLVYLCLMYKGVCPGMELIE